MKKIPIYITVALFVCFGMSLSVSAAVADLSAGGIVDSCYSLALDVKNSRIPSNYSYSIVLPRENYSYVQTFFCSKPILSVGDTFYAVFTNYLGQSMYQGSFRLDSMSNDSTYKIRVYGTRLTQGDGTNPNWAYGYFVENLSTAVFYNQSVISSYYGTTIAPIDKSALQVLINTAKAKQNDGYSFTTWQALQFQITAADNLLNTTGYTQAQVDAAKDNLQSALDGLRLLPDASELQDRISYAQGIPSLGYSPGTWQALQTAISSAQSLLESQDYYQSDIESALSNLQAALDALRLLPDTSELQNLISYAQSIADDGYLSETWQALQAAILSAQSLLESQDYHQSDIESSLSILQSAIDGLYIPPDTSEIESLLYDAEQIEDIGYTESSWNRLQLALAAVRSLLSLPRYTLAELEAAYSELAAAVDGLAVAGGVPPPSGDSPLSPAGYDVGTGDVTGFFSPATGIFLGYVKNTMPVILAVFVIIFNIKMLPVVFNRILRGLRR